MVVRPYNAIFIRGLARTNQLFLYGWYFFPSEKIFKYRFGIVMKSQTIWKFQKFFRNYASDEKLESHFLMNLGTFILFFLMRIPNLFSKLFSHKKGPTVQEKFICTVQTPYKNRVVRSHNHLPTSGPKFQYYNSVKLFLNRSIPL